ncbi:hypothetical protein PKF032_10050 [Polynucleobacter yangtzensis]|uniref:Uncharacterized protein n=1 Tax=Polynucleobacter yangtzensis TaxID=1743159 RepID=A0ABM8CMK6_9BURK|nr:hypothetical protein PKF032_10050 [Polynucleobacter yangtzensis]
MSWDKAVSRQHWSDFGSQGMPFQGGSAYNPETHWNDTIPYTNDLKRPKKTCHLLKTDSAKKQP